MQSVAKSDTGGPMNTIVCVKQVPEEIRINKSRGTLIRDGIKGVINPCDKNAIELAVALKEKHGGKVTLVSMGPKDVESTLTHGLAMGADEAVLMCDRTLAGADTLATALALATAIKKLGDFQLVLCGKETSDSGTQHVGPQLACFLGINQVTYVVNIVIEGDRARARRQLKDEYETVELGLPLLATVIKGINEPRMPTYMDIYEASSKETHNWCIDDLGLKEDQIGLKGSPTKIADVFAPEARRRCKMLRGSAEDMSNTLVEDLKSKDLV